MKKESEENKTEYGKRKMSSFWLRLWNLLEPSHKRIKNLLVLILVMEIFNLAGPYIIKFIIDFIVNFEKENISKIIFLVLSLFGVNQINSLVGYVVGKKAIYISSFTENDLLKKAQRKMMFLDLIYHEKENTGNKISKIRRGIDKIEVLMSDVFWQVAPTIIQIILTTIILYWVDWRFGLIFTFFIPIFILITTKLNSKADPYRKKIHDNWEKESGKMTQSIININTVKSFTQEEREVREFSYLSDKVEKNIVKMFGIIFKYNLGRDLVINAGEAIIIIFGVYLVWNSLITIGSLVFVITISQKALVSLYRISRLYDRIMDSSEAIDRLYALAQEEPNIKNPANGIKPKKIRGEIKFKNAVFTYTDSREKALDNVNLKISAECVTALVGPSGGGKTTLARMVYRHYDPQAGEVLLDDVNLKRYDISSFRKFISIVPQEVEIFNTSVGENISYANPGAGIEEIRAAAKIANAEEFINKLSNKYETLVGERGIKLSGGQRQRIGIARAILANPKILIFDEATSSLDSYSERLIQDAMEKIKKGRTMIIIAHRLSTIKKADRIIVLENGKVVEQGSHTELARTDKGIYAKLLKLQEMGDVE